MLVRCQGEGRPSLPSGAGAVVIGRLVPGPLSLSTAILVLETSLPVLQVFS